MTHFTPLHPIESFPLLPLWLQFMVRDLVARFIHYDAFNLTREDEIFTFIWIKDGEGKLGSVGLRLISSVSKIVTQMAVPLKVPSYLTR